MAIEVFMPKNGMDMQEGKIVRWLKNVGDVVEDGEAIMEIETDKITMEHEVDQGGTLLSRYYEDGDTVPVFTVLGYLGKPGEEVPATAPGKVGEAPAAAKAAPAVVENVPAAPQAAAPVAVSGSVAATPYAKKLAAEAGIPLEQVPASGKGGTVVKAGDVEKFKASPLAAQIAADKGVDLGSIQGSGFGGKVMKDDVLEAASSAMATRRPMSGMRRVIADRMFQSHSQIPTVCQDMRVYMDALLALREQINAGKEKADRITINDFIVKAAAKALVEFPKLRTRIEGDELVVVPDINIGVAVGLDEGLVVPVIRDADTIALSAVSKKSKELSQRARQGGLRPDDMQGGTFTISNVGMFGVESFTPIINQPEAAILGVNCINDELQLVDGQVVVKKVMLLSLTWDHRVMDGVDAAKFHQRIKQLLESPMDIIV